MAKAWAKFPYADSAYRYDGAALKKAWPRLHKGDCEPYPKDAAVADAWRHYHAGDFHNAVRTGTGVGGAGVNAAVKAQCVYAQHLERDAKTKLALFDQAAKWAEAHRREAPNDANAHYLVAYALGRYGQTISVAKALAQGMGGRIREALEHALELDPKHAEAATAFGAYQAEVIGKVGALVAGLTYGAKKDAALAQFERATKLFPESPIVRIEHANGLLLMFGNARLAEATKLYEAAAKLTPADAMEKLDVMHAKDELG